MTQAYRHRPLSEILVTDAEAATKAALTPQNQNGAAQQTAAPANTTIPEKYQGKSLEDVIQMHQNSERRLGQLQNEVGTYRGLVRDLSVLTAKPAAPTTEVTEPPKISGDELIADPVAAIQKVVQATTQTKTEPSPSGEQLVQNTEVALETQRLFDEFGDFGEIVRSEDFQTFASRTISRQTDLQTAAQGEGLDQVRAARRLLEDYRDFKELTANSAPSPVEQARKIATEAGNSTAVMIDGETYTQDQLVNMIRTDPAKWRSPSVQKAVIEAIKAGRYQPG